ncbi:hypothetical protein [Nostoc sp. LEGE 12450]|uniref:hypothetical protein n=1 Tax=Nostoc sp. LEGE 12450 TaxID=1828643 RepID=UPI00187F8163|nr:hypothetical protein [Nostoc sp. LEGE 12450]MBE8990612.1 hypothetical protein [Nostoc sp. LEGE 12450]
MSSKRNHSACGLKYEQALTLIQELKANNIDANITSGDVAVWLLQEEIALAQAICQRHGSSLKKGDTYLQDYQKKKR